MIAVRTAAQTDEPDILALWDEAFGEPDMAARWRIDPNHRSWTLVATDDDGIAGAVYLVDQRRRTAHGRIARVLGLANVAVVRRARAQGVARALTDEAVAFGRRAEYDWSLLFTGTPGVYAPSGYRPFVQHRRRTGALGNGASSGRPRGVSSAGLDVLASGALAQLHDGCGELPLAAVRDQTGWRRAASWYAGAELHVVADASGTATAYAVVRSGRLDGTAEVLEAAGERAALASLATVLRDDLRRDGVRDVTVELPGGPPFDSFVAIIAPDAEWVADDTGMFHPLEGDGTAVRETVEHSHAFHWTGDYL